MVSSRKHCAAANEGLFDHYIAARRGGQSKLSPGINIHVHGTEREHTVTQTRVGGLQAAMLTLFAREYEFDDDVCTLQFHELTHVFLFCLRPTAARIWRYLGGRQKTVSS